MLELGLPVPGYIDTTTNLQILLNMKLQIFCGAVAVFVRWRYSLCSQLCLDAINVAGVRIAITATNRYYQN